MYGIPLAKATGQYDIIQTLVEAPAKSYAFHVARQRHNLWGLAAIVLYEHSKKITNPIANAQINMASSRLRAKMVMPPDEDFLRCS